jgi:hypothetical protein
MRYFALQHQGEDGFVELNPLPYPTSRRKLMTALYRWWPRHGTNRTIADMQRRGLIVVCAMSEDEHERDIRQVERDIRQVERDAREAEAFFARAATEGLER